MGCTPHSKSFRSLGTKHPLDLCVLTFRSPILITTWHPFVFALPCLVPPTLLLSLLTMRSPPLSPACAATMPQVAAFGSLAASGIPMSAVVASGSRLHGRIPRIPWPSPCPTFGAIRESWQILSHLFLVNCSTCSLSTPHRPRRSTEGMLLGLLPPVVAILRSLPSGTPRWVPRGCSSFCPAPLLRATRVPP